MDQISKPSVPETGSPVSAHHIPAWLYVFNLVGIIPTVTLIILLSWVVVANQPLGGGAGDVLALIFGLPLLIMLFFLCLVSLVNIIILVRIFLRNLLTVSKEKILAVVMLLTSLAYLIGLIGLTSSMLFSENIVLPGWVASLLINNCSVKSIQIASYPDDLFAHIEIKNGGTWSFPRQDFQNLRNSALTAQARCGQITIAEFKDNSFSNMPTPVSTAPPSAPAAAGL